MPLSSSSCLTSRQVEQMGAPYNFSIGFTSCIFKTCVRVYLRSQKCWNIRQKAPDARRMSAALLGGMQANATRQMGLFGRIEQRWGVFRYTLRLDTSIQYTIGPAWARGKCGLPGGAQSPCRASQS